MPMAVNTCMKTTKDTLRDLAAVLEKVEQGMAKDPELLKRIEERSQEIRARVLKEHGILEVAVALVREARDE